MSLRDGSKTMESDSFFRSIPGDWFDTAEGDVESPSGWFGRITIDANLREVWANHGLDQIPASVEDGEYLVQITSSGLVYAWQEDVSGSLDAYLSELVDEYSTWMGDE